MTRSLNLKSALLLLPLLALTACDNNGSDNGPKFSDAAVIATRATGSGAISLADVNTPYTTQNNLSPSATTDIFVRSGGDHYFVIRRFRTNQISRYEISNPGTPVYTYSTEATSGEESNPSDLIIVSDTKAYLLRYGSGKIWTVNPSATTEAAFHTGLNDIDLSGYDVDGVPEMNGGLVKDGKLYVALQRLEDFNPVKNSYVAVIDVASNQEIDIKPNQDGLKGIELPVRNVGNLVAIPGSSKILAFAQGGFGDFVTFDYDGGLAAIDTAGYSASLLVDDGTPANHPYGQFVDLAVASADRAYLIGSNGFGADQTLYRFNPTNANPTPVPVAVTGFGPGPLELGSLAIDPNGKLWVTRTDRSAPGITILGFANGAETVEKDLINTSLVPINVDFVTVPVN